MAKNETKNIGFRLHLEKDVDILTFFASMPKSEKLGVFRSAIRNHMRGFVPQTDITHADIMQKLDRLGELLQGVTVTASDNGGEQTEPEHTGEHADLDAILMNFGEV